MKTVFLVIYTGALDGEDTYNCRVFSNYKNAKREFDRTVEEEKRNDCLFTNYGEDEVVVEQSESEFLAYLDGEYCNNHFSVELVEKIVEDSVSDDEDEKSEQITFDSIVNNSESVNE